MKLERIASFICCAFAPCMALAYDFDILDTTNTYYIFSSTNYPGGVGIGTGGINVVRDMNVGYSGQQSNGYIYVDTSATSPYTFLSAGNVVIGGALNVAGGFDLNMYGLDTAPIDVTIGGAVSNNGGGTLSFADIDMLSVGAMQNVSGNINVGTTGDFNDAGILQNIGSRLNLDIGGDVSIAGGIDGSNANGVIIIKSGGDFVALGGDTGISSIVNNGDFYALIDGLADIAYGFNLSGMGVNNVFSFEAGKLNIRNDNGLLWTNNINSFELKLTDSDSVVNAINIQNGTGNSDASMTVSAANINANRVVNNAGELLLSAGKDIVVDGDIEAIKGITKIFASGEIVADDVVNKADMQINGAGGVTIKSLSNFGGTLSAATDTSAGHDFVVESVLTNNSGVMTVKGNDISIGDMAISDGEIGVDILNVFGTGTVSFGGINVAGGTFNLDSLAGNIVLGGDALNVLDGTLNVGSSVRNLNVDSDMIVGGIVTLSGDDAVDAGAMNVAANTTITSTGDIKLMGGVSAVADDKVRYAKFDSDAISVGDAGIVVANKGELIFGNNNLGSVLNVSGLVSATDDGVIDIYSKKVVAGSIKVDDGALIVHGNDVSASDGGIDVAGGLWFDNLTHAKGLSIMDTTRLDLRGVMDIGGGIDVSNGNNLGLISESDISVSGLINVGGDLNITADDLSMANNVAVFDGGRLMVGAGNIDASNADLTVGGTFEIGGAGSGTSAASVKFADVKNTGNVNVNADAVLFKNIDTVDGIFTINSDDLTTLVLNVTGGDAKLNISDIISVIDLTIDGNLYQGGTIGGRGLWLQGSAPVDANSISVTGNFIVNSGAVVYTVDDVFNVGGNITVDSGTVEIDASELYAQSIYNMGTLNLSVDDTLDVALLNNSGAFVIDAPEFQMDNLVSNGKTVFMGSDSIDVANSADISGVLYQNTDSIADDKYVSILSDNYVFSADNFVSDGIKQYSGTLSIDSNNVAVHGDIIATDLAMDSDSNYLTAVIDGSVSDNVSFMNLQRLYVGEDYIFGNNSTIDGLILSDGEIPNSYWSSVDVDGVITNAVDGAPLISVGNNFVFDLGVGGINDLLDENQIFLTMFDIADEYDAIWVLNADNGIKNLDADITKFHVRYCNSDGSICIFYPSDYVSLVRRNLDANDLFHDLYIVFDSSLTDISIHKIQPIVGRVPGRTDASYFAAGAIDDLVAHQLHANGFYNKTPLSVLPVIFENTNMHDVANALYDRMDAFLLQRDGHIYERFSRLFEARDVEQLLGNIALNEHTYFRNFEDRMIDEFLWNRNRNLNKVWLDIDYGLYTQKTAEDVDADGNRFGVSVGFDWQQKKGLILGLSAHFNRLNSDANDSFNVGYLPSTPINGFVDTSVVDNSVGVGGYLMKNLGQGARLYGNAFIDLHMLDVERKQNYVADITGDGTAFGIISEWGLLHDWLNQYITGNLYARFGYNTGFDVTEKSAGADYMDLKSNGYAILTPGYTLTAQKRIYPSSWFQIRPYASLGAEYDVVGAPDKIKYKFAVANNWTDYDVEINPLWINAGAGVELISATGLQVGLDYRYQHNSDIQLHNFKLSGSYRF